MAEYNFTNDPQFIKPEDIKKGNSSHKCEWCADTGWMHTFGEDGRLFNDAPCFCEKGDEVIKQTGWGK